MVFTRKNERRKGFASMLVNSMGNRKMRHGIGTKQSTKFFKSLKNVDLECMYNVS